jgi:hypothetical protein
MIAVNNKLIGGAPFILGLGGMTIEENEGRWLRAKSRQLKERALGTADRTRRQQFLLIATEYQKLAQLNEGSASLDMVKRAIVSENGRGSRVGVVTQLRLQPRQRPMVDRDIRAGRLARAWSALSRAESRDVAIWAVLMLIAFALVLMPGDQTALGLRELLELLHD